MSSSARDLLVRGIAAAKTKDIDEARFYLEWVLRTDANRQQRIKAWYWLSEISDDPAEKRDLLENILVHEPGHAEARRSRAILDGVIDSSGRPKDGPVFVLTSTKTSVSARRATISISPSRQRKLVSMMS